MAQTETPGLAIGREDAEGECLLRLKGSFNRATAEQLRKAIGQTAGDAVAVVLDFSQVEEFQDLAVPILTEGLESRNVRVVGLPSHCERVFHCFGWHSKHAATSQRVQ